LGGSYSKIAESWDFAFNNGNGRGGTMNATYTFSTAVKYVGFWWLWGSTGNTVSFYDGSDNLLATLNSSSILNFFQLSSGTGSAALMAAGTVPTVDGGTHLKRYFYKSPIDYSGTLESPIVTYSAGSNEPTIYLNLFISGAAGVKKMVLSGANFEFDNLTVSLDDQVPRGDMVPFGTLPSAQALAWAPQLSNPVSSSPLTPSVAAATSTPAAGTGGAISYSLADAGSAGCSVNSSTGVITATSAGTCRVTAIAAAGTFGGTTYFQGSTTRTFTFTAANSTPPPSTGSSGQSAFKVTYEANGANGFRYQSSGTTTAALPMNNFQKPGHYFVGWNTKADGSGTAYPDRAIYAYASDMTLFAQWSKITAKHLVTTFNADKPVLLKGMKKKLRAWAKTLPADASLTCEGSTSGAKARAFDRRLAKARATNSCEFIQSLRPEITFTVTLNPASATAVKARHAWIYLNTESN
jgi:uncharacterized repeat protein (TIGR02543 family)